MLPLYATTGPATYSGVHLSGVGAGVAVGAGVIVGENVDARFVLQRYFVKQ